MDYFDRQPCNIHHSLLPTGSKEWSAEVVQRKYFVEPHIPEFAQFWRWQDKRVLDFGCGIGTDTLMFWRFGAIVDAVDSSEASLALAKKRCPLANFYKDLPIGHYDLVYSFGVIHHTLDPLLTLKRLHRRLAPAGELRIMLYAKWSWKFLSGQQPEAQPGCPIVHTYSKWQVRRLLKKAGFKVVSIKKRHVFSYRLPEYKKHVYVKDWTRFLPERLLGHHLLIVARKS
jgi:SAM-dependent methyltransferase